MAQKVSESTNTAVEALFKVGAHFGLIRSRRHPSVIPFLFGVKNKVEIFDLEKTNEMLQVASSFISKVVSEGGSILFVGGKNEARKAILSGGQKASMPYVAGRWLGGTLTNFVEIKKRINRLEELTTAREKGELGKYTKKERLLIDREIDTLYRDFSGLSTMKSLPKVMFVIDPRREQIAVAEAHKLHIPVVALASSDCNVTNIEYPIPGNDASSASIEHFVQAIVLAVEQGRKMALEASSAETPKSSTE